MAKSVSIEENSGARIAADSGLARISYCRPIRWSTASMAVLLRRGRVPGEDLKRSQNRVRTVVIRMGRVPFMDTTGLSALDEIVADFQRIGTRVCCARCVPMCSRNSSAPASWRVSAPAECLTH